MGIDMESSVWINEEISVLYDINKERYTDICPLEAIASTRDDSDTN